MIFFTKAGLKNNEDTVYTNGNFGFVIDGAITQINNDYNALKGTENVKSRPIFDTFGIFDKEILFLGI